MCDVGVTGALRMLWPSHPQWRARQEPEGPLGVQTPRRGGRWSCPGSGTHGSDWALGAGDLGADRLDLAQQPECRRARGVVRELPCGSLWRTGRASVGGGPGALVGTARGAGRAISRCTGESGFTVEADGGSISCPGGSALSLPAWWRMGLLGLPTLQPPDAMYGTSPRS